MTEFPEMRLYDTHRRSPDNGLHLYALAESLCYRDRYWGNIFVPQGFLTDRVSFHGFRRLFGYRGAPSSVVHDYACRVLTADGKLRRGSADDLFDRALKDEGVPWLLRLVMVAAVRFYTTTR